MGLRVFSFGGGVQSTAVLALAAQGKVEYDAFLFANVGDDSENPDTLQYIRDVSQPFADRHGILLTELVATRHGERETLLERIESDRRGFVIPLHLEGSGPMRRQCTYEFKIRLVARWLKQKGATKDETGTVGLGISLDEYQRMRSESGFDHYGLEYPLVDLKLFRSDCERIIKEAGLPVPPRSACWFCPYKSSQSWAELRRNHPDLWEAATDLEDDINARYGRPGKRLSLSSKILRLREMPDQGQLDDEDSCESGFCFT